MSAPGMLEHLAVPTLPDLLVAAAARHPEHTALTIGDTSWTYAELLDRATTMARGLLGLGVSRRSRVGLYLPNGGEFVESLLGASMLGATVVPINNRFRSRELAHVQVDARLAVVVTTTGATDGPDHCDRLLRAVAELGPGAPRPVVVCLGTPDPNASDVVAADRLGALARNVDPVEVDRARAGIRLRDLAAILYTSGTTALPKGCLHTHEALVRNGIVTGRSRFLLTSADRFWDPLPMFHVSFLTPLIACLDAGAEMLSMKRFEPEAALDMLEERKATWVFAAFQAVAGSLIAADSFARRRLESVRMTMCVGHPSDLQQFQAAFPQAQLLSTYGSTETGGVITYHTPDATAEQRTTTCGTPFRGVELGIRALDSARKANVGEVGEILVRGYSVLDGYLNDPVATNLALDADRWLHTGDLGLLDAEGHLVFRGRLKDMIKVGGENVAAAEVEEVLATHPAVAVAHVVGAPDSRLDEVIAAFVELAPGAAASAQDLVEYCADRIAAYKVPRHVRFVVDWPMSATKVRKEDLRQRIAAELTEDGSSATLTGSPRAGG